MAARYARRHEPSAGPSSSSNDRSYGLSTNATRPCCRSERSGKRRPRCTSTAFRGCSVASVGPSTGMTSSASTMPGSRPSLRPGICAVGRPPRGMWRRHGLVGSLVGSTRPTLPSSNSGRWSRIAEELARERARLSNRMREQLWRYYPQILEAVGSVADAWSSTSGPRFRRPRRRDRPLRGRFRRFHARFGVYAGRRMAQDRRIAGPRGVRVGGKSGARRRACRHQRVNGPPVAVAVFQADGQEVGEPARDGRMAAVPGGAQGGLSRASEGLALDPLLVPADAPINVAVWPRGRRAPFGSPGRWRGGRTG